MFTLNMATATTAAAAAASGSPSGLADATNTAAAGGEAGAQEALSAGSELPHEEEHDESDNHSAHEEHHPRHKKGHKKGAAGQKKGAHGAGAKGHAIHSSNDHGDHAGTKHGGKGGHSSHHGGSGAHGDDHSATGRHAAAQRDHSEEETLATRKAELEAEMAATLEVEVKRRVKLALEAAATRDYDAFSSALGTKSPMSRRSFAVFAAGSGGSSTSVVSNDGTTAAVDASGDAPATAGGAPEAADPDVPSLKRQPTAGKKIVTIAENEVSGVGGLPSAGAEAQSTSAMPGVDATVGSAAKPATGLPSLTVDTTAGPASKPLGAGHPQARGTPPVAPSTAASASPAGAAGVSGASTAPAAASPGQTMTPTSAAAVAAAVEVLKICVDPVKGRLYSFSGGQEIEFVDPSGRPVNFGGAPQMFASSALGLQPFSAFAGKYVYNPAGVASGHTPGDASPQPEGLPVGWPGAGAPDAPAPPNSTPLAPHHASRDYGVIVDAAYPQVMAGSFLAARSSHDNGASPLGSAAQAKQRQPSKDYRHLAQPAYVHAYQMQYGQQPPAGQSFLNAQQAGQLATHAELQDPQHGGAVPPSVSFSPTSYGHGQSRSLHLGSQEFGPSGSMYSGQGPHPLGMSVDAKRGSTKGPGTDTTAAAGTSIKAGTVNADGTSPSGPRRSIAMSDDASDVESTEFRRFAEAQSMTELEKRAAAGIAPAAPSRVDMFNQIFQTVTDPKKIELIRIQGPEASKRVHKGTNTGTDSSVPTDPNIKDVVLTGEGLHQATQATSLVDLSGSDIVLPSRVPPGHPPISAQNSRPTTAPTQPARVLKESEIKTIQDALSKALDAEACSYFLGELKHVMKTNKDEGNVNASTSSFGQELPIYDNQGGILLTRTYRNPTPPATFIELLSSSDNPLLYLHQEYASFLSKQQRVRLLNAAVLEDRVKNDLPQSKSAQLLLGKLLETMLMAVTDCNDMMGLLKDCEDRVQQVVDLLRRKPEQLQAVLASVQLKELFA
jgi:hypothetical protein